MFTLVLGVLVARFCEHWFDDRRQAGEIGALAGALLDGAIVIWGINVLAGLVVPPIVLFLLPVCYAFTSTAK